MTPSIRKVALAAHVTASVGWIGALAAFFAHALAAVLTDNELTVRAMSLAMGITAWFVIMPLSFATLLTGFVQALGTAWGVLRHYWVLFKLVLTTIATGVLLLKMAPISEVADAASAGGSSLDELAGLRLSLAVHAAGGLVVLMIALILALYKPQGVTRLGHRLAGKVPGHKMPRWAKALSAILVAIAALIGLIVLLGGHGPSAH